MYILDSSAIIEILKGTEIGAEIINIIGDESTVATAFSVHELLIGAKAREIEKIQKFFSEIIIMHFDKEAAIKSVEIEKEKRIEESDIFIAPICISHNAVLVTLDKDFENIKDLKLRLF